MNSFNPSSRTGSDQFADIMGEKTESASIHAPTRGVTVPVYWDKRSLNVSIHAPARGATAIIPEQYRHVSGFNPRSRTGSDLDTCYVKY